LHSHESIPPLEPGDHLTRDEFERRYAAMPDLKKAELIEGIVYMAAALRADRHGTPHFRLIGWLSQYETDTPGVTGSDNATNRIDLDSEPQPDVLLMIDAECGGQARLDEDGYVDGAPELVAEISNSSVSYDLHAKLRVYEKCGVREYIVWRVGDRQIDWFVLRSGKFEPLAADNRGWLCSETFPGLWLDAGALLGGKMKQVNAVLQQGLATSEHAAFVEKLEGVKRQKTQA
jgi:Uma2 family endonuclease